MSRFFSYINSAITILSNYTGTEPFASYSKKYFSANKKYGSKDRKLISHLCYCYFRTGGSLTSLSVEERLIAGLFLCSDKPVEMLEALKPGWNKLVHLKTVEKYKIIVDNDTLKSIFPWHEECSDEIEAEALSNSFLIQPDLFLRIRPGYEMIVSEKLKNAGYSYRVIHESCLSLSNSSKIDDILSINEEVVIQDYNSQRVGDILIELKNNFPWNKAEVWDCCAASGGKSIMAKDILGDFFLTVSDIRESIINNLKRRFSEASIKEYNSFIADLTMPVSDFKKDKFDLIIADIPCTGSGTWSRTPEQLFFFEPAKIDEYAKLQRSILKNVISYLKPGGYLLYITCSVFKRENEEAVEFLRNNSNLKTIKMKLLQGYEKKADSMFVALLQKQL